MEEKKYQKLATKSVFSLLVIFGAPVVLFVLIRNFLPIEIKTNKIFLISGFMISYALSWVIFYNYYFNKNIKK